jgi:hypothetical protein
MTNGESEYDGDSPICYQCIPDLGLGEIVRRDGEPARCCLCGKLRKTLTIREIAEQIDPVFRKYFEHGGTERQIGTGDDDTVYEEQRGEDLNTVVQYFIGDLLPCHDTIVSELIDQDDYRPQDGDEAFYGSDINYEEINNAEFAPYEDWYSIIDEVKTRRRFFSDRAREFFDDLFQDIEELSSYYREDNQDGMQLDFSDQPKGPTTVIQDWPVGTPLYRGRRADTKEQYTRLLSTPAKDLAPPPSSNAKAGRMNPEGVSVFYGALDVKTCLAEMRSSIGGHIVTAEFQTTHPLKVVDFRRLEKAWGKQLSYFQSDYRSQAGRRVFLRRLHRLISEPIVPGHESEYLITQVLAEYLGHVREKSFDGLLFRSTQRENGTNVVLFPKKYADPDSLLIRFSLRFIAKTERIHRTRGIEYDTQELRHLKMDDGEIHVYGLYDDD